MAGAIDRLAISQPDLRTGRWFPANPIHYHSSEISWSRVLPVGRGTGAPGNDYQALAAGFVHPQAGFASSPTSTTSTPGLRMISRTEISFESQDRDLMIESAIIDSR